MYKLLFLSTAAFLFTSIYSFSIPSATGAAIDFNQFRGKKILIVNTASNSPLVKQYGGLESLYQKYKASLVIVAIPSNSFGNEPGDNLQIQTTVHTNYSIHYYLAGKMNIQAPDESPLYQWLTQSIQNTQMNSTIKGDFQKYLIDKDGTLIGYFKPQVDPMDEDLLNAIEGK